VSGPFDREAAEAYVNAVWGDHEGWACVAFGHDGFWNNGKYGHGEWKQKMYRWPDKRAELLDEIATRLAAGRVDVYAAPLLRLSEERKKDNAAHRDLVWADADLVDLAAIEPLAPMVVNSGRDGHAHVYIRLDGDAAPEEREALARGLMARAGECDPKIADNDVLRVPGTLNFKTDPPGPVTWHTPPGDHVRRWKPHRLAQALGTTLTPPAPKADVLPFRQPARIAAAMPFRQPRTPELERALNRRTDDRSDDVAAVWGAAYRAGWTPEDAVRLVREEGHPINGKWNESELLADARRFWPKASEPRSRSHDDPSDLIASPANGTLAAEAAPPVEQDPADWWKPIADQYEPVDWHKLWEEAPEEVEWLVEPLIERGQSISIYSPPKAGKSLITLEIAAALATGRPVLGNEAREPMPVLYVDIENSPKDIKDRLSAMGYKPGDLGNLRYLSFPSLPALDSAKGGQHLLAVALAHTAELVVIDTVSRVISGSENDADTFASLYRHALAPLKGLGVSVIRLDHSGKDVTQGQRGSSAKAADVDTVWLLVKKTDTALHLQRQESRSGRGEPLIELVRRYEPLRHERANGYVISAQISDLIERLDSLGVPNDAGRDKATAALRQAGAKFTTKHLAEAIKMRKLRLNLSRTGGGADRAHPFSQPVRVPVREIPETADQTCSEQVADRSNSQAGAVADDLFAACPSLKDGQPNRSARLTPTGTCEGCGGPMKIYRPGQTRHPNDECDPRSTP